VKFLESALAGSVDKPKAALWNTVAWALLALAATLPIVLLGFYAYRVTATSLRAQVAANNLAVASTAAQLMGLELDRRLALASTLAAMPGLINAVEQHDEEAVRARLRVAVESYPGVDRALVADPEAIIWTDYPRDTNVLGKRFSHRDWYQGVTNGWRPYVSEVYLRIAAPTGLVVAIAAPIVKDRKPLGILVHHYRLEDITGWVQKIPLGNHGGVFVIDHTGTVAAHSHLDEDRLRRETIDDYGSLLPVTKALTGVRSDSCEFVDPLRQHTMVASFLPVQAGSKHWAVVTEQPIEDAYAPVQHLRLQMCTAAGVLGLAALAVALLLGRSTERNRRLNRQLAEERNLLRSLIDTLPDLVYVKDTESRFIIGNKAVARLVGAKVPDDILGRTDAEFFPPELASRYRADEVSICRSGVPIFNQEEPVLDRDGTRQWLTTTKVPLRDSQGHLVGVVGIGRDITRRKQTEEALRTSEARLQAILDNTSAVVYMKDTEGRYLLINRQYEQLFHVKRDQILGRTDHDIFPKEVAEAFARNDRAVLEEGRPRQIEEVAPHDDGPHIYLSVKFPLHTPAGRSYAICGISTDITDRKRAEAEVQRAREAAEQASQAKSEFLANMSHELRTPLNSVIGFANIMLKNKGGNLRPEDLIFLERILVNGRHLLALINQILDLSKIEARRIEVESETVALERLVPEVLSQFEAQVRGRPLQLKAELPLPIAPLLTDQGRLKQVLLNLVGNAVKFTERGSVRVRVVVEEDTRRPTRIEVIDTGIGIAPDRHEVIFEAFRQADASTTRKYGGTGLGLTISRALCDLMGCRIEVKSDPGQGSTFSIVLPLPAAPAAPAAPATPATPAAPAAPAPALLPRPAAVCPAPDKLVLVIDDEADSRALLRNLIEECGCRVVVAESGQAGLRLARELRPNLITLDLLMPQMDGWTVLGLLKADPALCGIPVVIVSVVGTESRGTLLCARAVLQKPVMREDLLRVLQAFPRPKVLVVEDNEDHRRLMAAHLEGHAAEIGLAANGCEALRWLEKSKPDLVLLDLMMPHMDGMTFLSTLRKDPRYCNLPVFVVTAKELSPEETQCLAREAQAVLRKFNDWGEDLDALLRRVLQPQAAPACDPALPPPEDPAARAPAAGQEGGPA
jgi:PAS domain S-box-containing protein